MSPSAPPVGASSVRGRFEKSVTMNEIEKIGEAKFFFDRKTADERSATHSGST
jgi:hypothetical protein